MNTAIHFIASEVNTIVGLKETPSDGFHRCLLEPWQLDKLLTMKVADPNRRQNDSPSIREFLEIAHDVQEDDSRTLDIEFQCYVVYPPRADARVSVEGIEVRGVADKPCIDLLYRVRQADDLGVELQEDGTWNLTAWWD